MLAGPHCLRKDCRIASRMMVAGWEAFCCRSTIQSPAPWRAAQPDRPPAPRVILRAGLRTELAAPAREFPRLAGPRPLPPAAERPPGQEVVGSAGPGERRDSVGEGGELAPGDPRRTQCAPCAGRGPRAAQSGPEQGDGQASHRGHGPSVCRKQMRSWDGRIVPQPVRPNPSRSIASGTGRGCRG